MELTTKQAYVLYWSRFVHCHLHINILNLHETLKSIRCGLHNAMSHLWCHVVVPVYSIDTLFHASYGLACGMCYTEICAWVSFRSECGFSGLQWYFSCFCRILIQMILSTTKLLKFWGTTLASLNKVCADRWLVVMLVVLISLGAFDMQWFGMYKVEKVSLEVNPRLSCTHFPKIM